MKIKKILILLLIPLFSDILVACCDCGDSKILKYTNSDLAVQNLDNRGQSPVVAVNDIALREAFGIRMTVKCETTASVRTPFSFFINRSYAFSCRCGPETEYQPKDSIVAIRIITLENFDANHNAGADISDYFRLYTWNNFTGISDYLKKEAKVFADEESKNIELNALLMQAPVEAGLYHFRIEMDLSDGRSFVKETPTVELQ